MDVSNLVPTQGSTPASGSTRAKPDAALPVAASASPVAPAGTVTPRPAAPTASVSDRIERSPELDRRISELKRELNRQAQVARERAGEVSVQVQEAKAASHETLLRAALGILRGELFFVSS